MVQTMGVKQQANCTRIYDTKGDLTGGQRPARPGAVSAGAAAVIPVSNDCCFVEVRS